MVTYTGFQVNQNSPGDVARIVALVIKDIFSIAAFCREILQVSILTDAVLLAKLLPELTADFSTYLVGIFSCFMTQMRDRAYPEGSCVRGLRRDKTDCYCRTGRLEW